jgi:hypothetical protein
MAPDWPDNATLDPIAFEWDYFMIHDRAGRFTGSVGYLIANPHDLGAGGLGDLLPKGGNVAVAGLFADASLTEYVNFGLEGFSASATDRAFLATGDGGRFGRITPHADRNALTLEGRTELFAWALEVTQEWPGLSAGSQAFHRMRGRDVGDLTPGEEWNVDMLWPRTRVAGTLTRRDTDEQLDIDGHGYREDSFGRWAFNGGGWDFAVVSDESSHVLWAWQSYHHLSSSLDYLDVAFVDQGRETILQLRADRGELGWSHAGWRFDPLARQCRPGSTLVRAQDDTYRIEARATLGDAQLPMLSDATVATRAFVIFIQFPAVEGTITRRDTGRVVATFSGQGGGEFSVARAAVDAMTEAECEAWGAVFSAPTPW